MGSPLPTSAIIFATQGLSTLREIHQNSPLPWFGFRCSASAITAESDTSFNVLIFEERAFAAFFLLFEF